MKKDDIFLKSTGSEISFDRFDSFSQRVLVQIMFFINHIKKYYKVIFL